MREFSSIHLLMVTLILVTYLALPLLLYCVGGRVGDGAGYIRGYKDGQQSMKDVK